MLSSLMTGIVAGRCDTTRGVDIETGGASVVGSKAGGAAELESLDVSIDRVCIVRLRLTNREIDGDREIDRRWSQRLGAGAHNLLKLMKWRVHK